MCYTSTMALRPYHAVLALSLTCCYNAKIRTAAHPEPRTYTDTGVALFWGASNTTTDAIECPFGLAYAETYHPWWGRFLVSPLTLGLVEPIRKVYVCASPPSQR